MRKPIWITALGVAVAATLLVVPVPYSHTVGYDLVVHRADGKSATIHLPRGNAAQAERRAATLRGPGVEVAVEPRTERVWGSVYAMAKEKVLRIDVDLSGKSDADAEQEIAAQLEAAGWTPATVHVDRSGDLATVQVGVDDGAGRHIDLIHKGGDGHVEIQAGDIDDTREPGMTDEQLRAKIVKQFQDRGMNADVMVDGSRVEIHAHRAP